MKKPLNLKNHAFCENAANSRFANDFCEDNKNSHPKIHTLCENENSHSKIHAPCEKNSNENYQNNANNDKLKTGGGVSFKPNLAKNSSSNSGENFGSNFGENSGENSSKNSNSKPNFSPKNSFSTLQRWKMSKLSLADFLSQEKLKFSYKNDVYFDENYAKCYGEVFSFEFRRGELEFKAIANKERIFDSEYFDLSSPYGYSGFYANTKDEKFIAAALKALKERALSENIIAFFIRFHPFDENLALYERHLNFFLRHRKVVIVPTNRAFAQIRCAYSPRIKSYVKKARNELEITPCDISCAHDFTALYHETMDRNGAEDFYFFDEKYFEKLFDLPSYIALKASLNGENLAFASFFVEENFAYYHLSANKCVKNANSALLDAFFELCSQKKVDFAILGGGLHDDDSLFYFKQRFSTLYGYQHIGGLVFNEQIYKKFKATSNSTNFLGYRF